jgi:hypothetical protein
MFSFELKLIKEGFIQTSENKQFNKMHPFRTYKKNNIFINLGCGLSLIDGNKKREFGYYLMKNKKFYLMPNAHNNFKLIEIK